MGNVLGCVAAGLGWCCCTAVGSLISSCCGNDKNSTVPPGATSGRKRSVLLLMISIVFAMVFQYVVGPRLKPNYRNKINPVLAYLADAWIDGCEEFVDDDESSEDYDNLRQKCSGNNGVYRVAGSALLFFILTAVAACCKPTANREAWPAKYVLFLLLITGTVFIPNEPLFSSILMNIFRIGGVIFMIFNQLILLDMTFNVNESWVAKGDQAELDEGEGAGKKWFGALLATCALLYLASFVAIGLMYYLFSGCGTNTAFITITLIVGIVSTGIQLTGEEASLFASAAIFAYSTFLLYTAVSKNPNDECNPQLGEENVLGIVLGVGLTMIGVLWTGYSKTAYRAVGEEDDAVDDDQSGDGGRAPNTRVTGEENYGATEDNNEDNDDNEEGKRTFSSSWKLNVILALITCWYAMALTSWGSITDGGTVANPQVGRTSMWMIIGSQWLMVALYLWTLLAPKLFPDRDFS